MEKLLALAQHLEIPYIEDGDQYYFGVDIDDYNEHCESLESYCNEMKDDYEGIDLDKWCKAQDSYIDFESEVEINGDYYTYDGKEYLILDDSEADDRWEQYIDDYIDECVLPDLPERYQCYFDREAFMRDCKSDGRGHSLAGYDGIENEATVERTTYYIYRTN